MIHFNKILLTVVLLVTLVVVYAAPVVEVEP